MQHISNSLQQFIEDGGYVRIVIGIDQHGSSFEGISGLSQAIGNKGELWINHDVNKYVTFHPKLYLFEAKNTALLIIGSGNLTQGGLFTNDEASLAYYLDLLNQEDRTLLKEVKTALDKWCNKAFDSVQRLDEALLQKLLDADYIRREEKLRKKNDVEKQGDNDTKKSAPRPRLFGRGPTRHYPTKIKRSTQLTPADQNLFDDDINPRGFVMTLMRTDVGAGQTTPGASRRSPEIFVPISARNKYPSFWNWPDAFTEDASKLGKFDRSGVLMRIGGDVVAVNMMTWPDKHDFRLRSEALRSAGQVGDILCLEKTYNTQDFTYYVEIIPVGTSAYESFLDLCNNKTPNSKRRWGYYD